MKIALEQKQKIKPISETTVYKQFFFKTQHPLYTVVK